jgi:hypothetical protein
VLPTVTVWVYCECESDARRNTRCKEVEATCTEDCIAIHGGRDRFDQGAPFRKTASESAGWRTFVSEVDAMQRDTAREVVGLAWECMSRLNEVLWLIRQNCPDTELQIYLKPVGHIMGRIVLDVIERVYAEHPDLDTFRRE